MVGRYLGSLREASGAVGGYSEPLACIPPSIPSSLKGILQGGAP